MLIAVARKESRHLNLQSGDLLAPALLAQKQAFGRGDIRSAELPQEVLDARLGDLQTLLSPDSALPSDRPLALAGAIGLLDDHGRRAALDEEVDEEHRQDHEDGAGHDQRHQPGREPRGHRKNGHQKEERGGQSPRHVSRHRLVGLDIRPLLFSQRFREDGDPALQRAHPVERFA